MSDVTTAFVQAFTSNFTQLAQQKGSKLEAYVTRESLVGEKGFYDQIAPTYGQERAGRNSDTPLVDADYRRRMVVSKTWDWAHLFDKPDEWRMLSSPLSKHSMNAADAAGRYRDQIIVDAMLGTAYTGKDGTTAVTLPAGQLVAHGNTQMNLSKVLDAKQILDDADIDPERRHIAMTPFQLRKMLEVTEIKSSDYNTIKALIKGEVDTFLGFKWHMIAGKRKDGTKILPLDGNGRVRCVAWQHDCVLLAQAGTIVSRIGERADKNYSMQAFLSQDFGATRMQEEGVVEIPCNVT